MALLSVDDLLKHPFPSRELESQHQIVLGGKPQLAAIYLTQANINILTLSQKIQWLTYCAQRKKYFCWTCLMFCHQASKVRESGSVDDELELSVMLKAADEHENSPEHLEATMKLQLFMTENFLQAGVQAIDRTQHNLAVKKNHGVFTRIIDAVCCAVCQEKAYHSNRYSFNILESDDCLKILRLMASRDKANADLMDGAIDLVKGNPTFANGIVDAITRVLKMAIVEEINKSTHVSVIVSEHGAHKGKSQISLVFRYVCDGKVCERFVGFTNQYDGVRKSPDEAVWELVQDTVKRFGIADKFMALSVDGAALPWKLLPKLVVPNTETGFHPYLIPWHSHGFGRVLLQSLATNDEYTLFLKRIDAMENFFRKPEIFEKLESGYLSKARRETGRKGYKKSPFIIVVNSYRVCFVQFFDSVIQNCNKWHDEDVAQAVSYRSFLGKLLTVFLLNTVNKLFSGIFNESYNFTSQQLQKSCVFNNPKLNDLKHKLGTLQLDSFQPNEFIAEVDPRGSDSKLRAQLTRDTVFQLTLLRRKICQYLHHDVIIMWKSLQRLLFCDIPHSYQKMGFAHFYYESSQQKIEIPPFFDNENLAAEINALVQLQHKHHIFDKKSVYDLIDYLRETDLYQAFPQLYKMVEIMLTVPYLPPSREKGKSKLEDINRCSYIPQSPGIPSGEVSVLCVEREMLLNLRKSSTFYDSVIARFNEADKSMQLSQV